MATSIDKIFIRIMRNVLIFSLLFLWSCADNEVSIGIALYKDKKFIEAIPHFSNALKKNPDDTSALRYRGLCYFETQKYGEAIKDLGRFNHLGGGGFIINDKIADAYLAIADYKDAEIYYFIAMHIDSSSPAIYYNLGLAGEKLHEDSFAMSYFLLLKTRFPNYAYGYFGVGKILSYMNKYKESISNFNKAISINMNDPDFFFYRGLSFYSLLELNSALDDFNRSISLQPHYKLAFLARAHIYKELGNITQSCLDYQNAKDSIKDVSLESYCNSVK